MESERFRKGFGRCLHKSVTYNLHLQSCKSVASSEMMMADGQIWLIGCRGVDRRQSGVLRKVVVWCQTQGPSDHRCERWGFISAARTYFRCLNVLNDRRLGVKSEV
jgi:hypothetical protein